MSPEDRYQEVNIPIEEDRLVDLLVYTSRASRPNLSYVLVCISKQRRNGEAEENVSLHFQEIRDNHR